MSSWQEFLCKSPVNPSDSVKWHLPIEYGADLTPVEAGKGVRGIEQNLWRLCFRVHIEYRDVFGERRYANFGYSANNRAIEPLPKYNDSN